MARKNPEDWTQLSIPKAERDLAKKMLPALSEKKGLKLTHTHQAVSASIRDMAKSLKVEA